MSKIYYRLRPELWSVTLWWELNAAIWILQLSLPEWGKPMIMIWCLSSTFFVHRAQRIWQTLDFAVVLLLSLFSGKHFKRIVKLFYGVVKLIGIQEIK
jgi:hypothetical protein